jgi:hypothetical protein
MEKYLHSGALTQKPSAAWVPLSMKRGGPCKPPVVYFKSRSQAEATRDLLALRIIEVATLGERDPHRLREEAMLHLAQSSLAQRNSRHPGL